MEEQGRTATKIEVELVYRLCKYQDENRELEKRITDLETAIRNIIACGKKPMWAGLHDACEKAEKLLKG